MDLVASCKDKLAYFRIKELKDVLTQLGLSKQGKKQDLVDRILSIVSDERVMWPKKNAVGKEGVAKLVDDTYRKMQVSGPADVVSKSQAMSDSPSIKLKEVAEDSYPVEKIRCLCGSTLGTDSMIKCEDPKCNVWQHIACVLLPEKPMEGVLPNPPDVFYCEICRLSRADPFWVTVAHPLNPVKLNITNVPADGSNPSQSIEKTFQLTRADRELLSKQEYDVQAWCMLLNDKVTFRMQWPQYADLQINGVQVRAINRPGSQLLGANGRDDGPIITPYTRDGINKIFLGGVDTRIFCVGIRIVKRRTLQQVLNMIPKENEGEPFEDALTRVRRCVGGGAATENADSDSDIEVVADFIPVNLRCPNSGLRMKVAGRFKPCAHMGCFDLDVFVEMNQRSRKWQCPICLKNYSLEKMIIDPYFNRITSKMRSCGEDVADIEVKPDGSWRAKPEAGDRRGLGELGLWHLPDGTLCPSTTAESKPKVEVKQIKQEAGSDSHAGLRLGMRKNENGRWEINKPDNNFLNNGQNQNIIPMSSSGTGSGRDCEDASVNQDEFESISANIDHAIANTDVIVLTDTDEEEVDPAVEMVGNPFSNGVPDPYYENTPVNGGSSSLGLFSDEDFGISMWPLPSEGAPSFQLFGSDVDVNVNVNVSDPLVEVQHGYNNMGAESAAVLPESSGARNPNPNSNNNHNNNNDDDGLVDTSHLSFNGIDPSLQIFLPTRPSDESAAQKDLRVQNVGSGVGAEDWISLRLGDGVGRGRQGNRANTNNGSGLNTLADSASFLLGKSSRERSDSPFNFPRQRRSVRPRMYLSIDSESE